MQKKLYLIRHGETIWNANGRWQGMMDIDLNEIGIQQAEALGELLKPHPIKAIYASDLKRARITAEKIAQHKGLDVHTDPRLRELNLGILQGLTYEEIKAAHPEEFQSLTTSFLDAKMPQGESRREMQHRAHQAVMDILKHEHSEEIAIVSHGGTIRVLLMRWFPNSDLGENRITNTSITTVEYRNEQFHLKAVGETPHLVETNPNVGKLIF